MNNIFTGGSRRGERIYGYSGSWSRAGGKISWKAIVQNDGVVCRPAGTVDDELSDDASILAVVTQLIETSLTEALRHEARSW
jgi:hypothetical protein